MQSQKSKSQRSLIKFSGFTLIEMLAVLGILAVVSSVVLFNHGKFTNQTILTNMAYELALSIREAQIYGVSVRAVGGSDFQTPYGIYIPNPPSDQYILFADNNGDGEYNLSACGEAGSECVTTYSMQRNIQIVSVDYPAGESDNCPPGQQGNQEMNILFKRPNPEPFFQKNTGEPLPATGVQIKIESDDGSVRYVIVYNNGQITVENTDKLCQ